MSFWWTEIIAYIPLASHVVVVDDDDVTNESTRQSTRHILCL